MQQQEPKTVAIGEENYIIGRFLADRGLKVFVRVSKVIAEPMARAAALKDTDDKTAAFGQVLGEVASSLVERLDEDEVIKTVQDLLTVVIPEGQTVPLANPANPNSGTWKTHFQGRLGHLMAVLNAVVSENFEDFLSVLKNAVVKADALRKQKAKSPGPTI